MAPLWVSLGNGLSIRWTSTELEFEIDDISEPSIFSLDREQTSQLRDYLNLCLEDS